MEHELQSLAKKTLLTESELMDAISYVNEGTEEINDSEIVRYSARMYFVAVRTDVMAREIAEQYEGFSSFISQGDTDGLVKFMRTDMPLLELRASDDPLLQGRSAVAFLANTCANAARSGGLPVARCYAIVENYLALANETSNEELVHYLMLPMMLELAKAVSREGNAYKRPLSWHAMTYVRSHLAEDLSGDVVAEALDVSRKTLCTRFKQETGDTFSSYVRRIRVERARRLIDTSELTLSQIAYQTGFASQSHMQTVFKSVTGYTPREWRMREVREI